MVQPEYVERHLGYWDSGCKTVRMISELMT
jgi:hypothetical protein